MQKVFILLTTNNPDKATRAMQFAKLASDRDALAGVMLVDDAVYLALPDIMDRTRAVTGDSFSTHIHTMVEGQYMIVCAPCCEARGIDPEEFYPVWTRGTGHNALDRILCPNVTTMTF